MSIGGIPESGLLEVGTWSKGTGVELWSAVALRRNGLVPDITRKCGRGLHEGRTCARRSMTPGRGAASFKDVDIERSLHILYAVRYLPEVTTMHALSTSLRILGSPTPFPAPILLEGLPTTIAINRLMLCAGGTYQVSNPYVNQVMLTLIVAVYTIQTSVWRLPPCVKFAGVV